MRYKYVEERGRFLPIIPIRLEGKNGWVTFSGYVDSGATYSIFRAEIAEILSIDIEKGEKQYVVVGDGSLIRVYIHRIIIELAGKIFEASIGFSRQLGIGVNIIGRKDIFDRFIICFNERDKHMEFRENI